MAVYDSNGNVIATMGGGSSRINGTLEQFFLIAHRGTSFYPENTLIACENAVKTNGYKAVEFDFRFTSDNVCVALHDASINRTARNSDGTTISSTINIASITYAQALEYDFGIYKGSQYAGQKIPTLKEFLLCCKRYGVVAELDIAERNFTDAQYAIIYNTVKDCGMIPSTIFTIDAGKASKITSLDDSVVLCVSGRTSTALIDAVSAFPAGLMICSCPVENFTEALATYAHQKGYKIKTWTVNSESTIESNLDDGVDAIITDSYLPSNI